MVEKNVAAPMALDETKRAIDTLGECSAKIYNLNWKKIAQECQDLDDAERKELIAISAKKLLAALLAIISA